jgi:probable rRNA maturation factor
MITLEILEGYRSLVNPQPIEIAAKTTLQQQSALPDADLTIVITDNDQLRQLNREYRDIDSATDVLSFPADFMDPENELPYLGDILISYERAEDQAVAGGHEVIAELQLLVVHGVLHLLGHDHANQDEKTKMWAVQNEILRQLGLDTVRITGDE